MKKNLAIVIPAYKADFFDAALRSIARQTCKDFTVYVGDDCSPNNLQTIVDNHPTINIVYKRFEENLGGKNLVAQWERCIDLVQDEEWIWLFSDDDVMEDNCVEFFYRTLKKEEFDLYRFNVNVIDEKGDKIQSNVHNVPKVLDNYTFFKKRISGKMNSFVVEYIFNKSKFYEVGRFQNFDLAWGSDVATWIKLSDKGIFTIENTAINWRSSGVNISPNVSPAIVERKMYSVADFFSWVYIFFKKRNRNTLLLCHKSMLKRLKESKDYLSEKQTDNIIDKYSKSFPLSNIISFSMRLTLKMLSR